MVVMVVMVVVLEVMMMVVVVAGLDLQRSDCPAEQGPTNLGASHCEKVLFWFCKKNVAGAEAKCCTHNFSTGRTAVTVQNATKRIEVTTATPGEFSSMRIKRGLCCGPVSVRPSVRLSVTFVHSIQTAEDIVKHAPSF